MENCSCFGFSEDVAAWCHCQAAVNEGTSFQVPCWLDPPGDSNGYSSVPPFEGVEEDRAASASKSHSQAEKRRRDRINAQLATLRKLIPKSDKMDKAALLGSVVEHVKELKRRSLEVSKMMSIPTDMDEVTIMDQEPNSTTGNIFIRVLFCCDDRPELFAELNHAMEGLRLRMIQADMTSLGGRIKGTFVLCTKDGTDHKNGTVAGINTLKQALKLIFTRIVVSSAPSNYRGKSKRQRFFFPSHYSQ